MSQDLIPVYGWSLSHQMDVPTTFCYNLCACIWVVVFSSLGYILSGIAGSYDNPLFRSWGSALLKSWVQTALEALLPPALLAPSGRRLLSGYPCTWQCQSHLLCRGSGVADWAEWRDSSFHEWWGGGWWCSPALWTPPAKQTVATHQCRFKH